MSENTSTVSAPKSDPKAGMKITFVGIILILTAIAFVLVNVRGREELVGAAPFGLHPDKQDATYRNFEMPIFRISGARPGEKFTAQLKRDGKTVAREATPIIIDERGEGLLRGDFVTGDVSDQYDGAWTASVSGESGQSAFLQYHVVAGCSDESPVVITTDKKSYRVGEEIHYKVSGPKNTQIRWFGLTGRADRVLSMDESNAYYGDLTDVNGKWESDGLLASLPEGITDESSSTSIVSVCDKTAQVKIAIQP